MFSFKKPFWKRPDSSEKYTLSVCAIFKNEAAYLREWIEYHLLAGVEHFFLYNNESCDHYLEVLTPYMDQQIVELKNWPKTETDSNWLPAQRGAYRDCIQRSKGVTKWLALIDIDEFIVPVDKPDLIHFLSSFDQSVGAIQINWQLYGTSGLLEIPKDQLLIESLTAKAPWDYTASVGPDNRRFKSIVRPKAVDSFDVHAGSYKRGFTIFPKEPAQIQIDQIRINHYWTRSETYFYQVKIGRRFELNPSLSKEIFLEKLEHLNKVDDPILKRYVPQLKERLFSVAVGV